MNEIIFKDGDRVLFRKDGIIGMLNQKEIPKEYLDKYLYIKASEHSDLGIGIDGMEILDGYHIAIERLELCNDFSGIGVGDMVELGNGTTGYVTKINRQSVNLSCELSCNQRLYVLPKGRIYNDMGNVYLGIARILEKAKPKPLLADAKVADLVKLETGKWHTIKAIVQQHESCLDFLVYGLDNGRYYAPNGNGMRTDNPRIVEWQPLAPEGSAEWAVQRMKLGDMVCNSIQEFVGYWSIVNGYCFHAHSGHRCSPEKFPSLVNVKTGWQLYEPEPKPCPICNGTGFVKYYDMDGITTQSCSCHHISEQPKQPFANVKKGDFVKHLDGRQLRIVEIKEPASLTSPHVKDRNKKFKCDNGNSYSVVDGSCVCNDDTITRILKPSEVRVKITLEGTVEKRKDNRFSFNLVSGITNSAIHYDMLDPATADLVLDLIAKQKGYKND